MGRRFGILGGSFDPIHVGHLIKAQDAVEHCDLDVVFFVPTAQSPLKKHSPVASNEQRLEMIERSIAGYPQFQAFDWELTQGGTSYTIETVNYLKEQFPEDSIYWIIGADQVVQLNHWKAIDELVSQVHFICFERPGFTWKVPEGIASERIIPVSGHVVEISSSEIRERLSGGQSADFFLSAEVAKYIKKYDVY